MTVPCVYCGSQVNPDARSTYRRVIGWEQKADRFTARRGGSDIYARELLDVFACTVCVDKLRAGVAPAQESLL